MSKTDFHPGARCERVMCMYSQKDREDNDVVQSEKSDDDDDEKTVIIPDIVT